VSRRMDIAEGIGDTSKKRVETWIQAHRIRVGKMKNGSWPRADARRSRAARDDNAASIFRIRTPGEALGLAEEAQRSSGTARRNATLPYPAIANAFAEAPPPTCRFNGGIYRRKCVHFINAWYGPLIVPGIPNL
jgi:hypothetical protein